MLRALHVALTFLTTLPVLPVRVWGPDDARRSVRAYPLVGLILGAILWGAWWLFVAFPEPVRGALLLGVGLLLTGALHLDGFCDVADAACSSAPPERRREILKDPHLGAFALAAGGTLLLVKAAAFGSLAQPVFLLVIPLLSRTLVVLPLTFGPTHASSRLGRDTRTGLREALVPLVLGLTLTAVLGVLTAQLVTFLALATAALLTVGLLSGWLSRRLGGLGGDAYGAVIETSEAVMLTLATLA